MNVADLEHDSGMTDDDEEDRKFLLLVALALLLRRMFRKRKFVANMQPRRQLDVAKSMWAKYIKETTGEAGEIDYKSHKNLGNNMNKE